MPVGKLQKFASLFLQLGYEERAKELIQSISWASESEAVDPAAIGKTVWVPINTRTRRTKLVFCLVFKLRDLSFRRKCIERFQCKS